MIFVNKEHEIKTRIDKAVMATAMNKTSFEP